MSTTFDILIVPSLQILAGMLFIFGVYARFIFPILSSHSLSDRITCSIAGMGGIIIVVVYVAVWLRMMDFISVLFFLVLLPLFRILIKNRFNLKALYIPEENTWVLYVIELIERLKKSSISDLKPNKYLLIKHTKFNSTALAFIVALIGGILRLQPVQLNIAPFNFTWFDTLDKVKNTMLGIHPTQSAEPAGLEATIYFFTTILQIRPEFILNLLGFVITVLLSFIVYKIILELTAGNSVAALLGLVLFALVPGFILPVSVVKQVSTSGSNLAILFAASAFWNFIRYMKKSENDYLISFTFGIIAAGLTNYFILIIVLPFLFLPGLFILSAGKKEKMKALFGLIAGLAIPQLFYIFLCTLNGTSFNVFIKTQLFKTSEFSFFPELIFTLEYLTYIYLSLAATLFVVSVLSKRILKKDRQLVLLITVITMLFSLPFLSFLKLEYEVIDVDQLTGFYSFLIAVFLGSFLGVVIKIFKLDKIKIRIPPTIPITILVFIIVISQKDRLSSRELYHHLTPKEFFEAYYKIVSERLPYTYAIAAPDFGATLAKNRHYFINYNYLLNDYAARDSLYQKALLDNDLNLQKMTKLPASVFIFIERSDHITIPSHVLYDAKKTMKNVLDWITDYELKRDKLIRIYFRSEYVTVFEIVNERRESDNSDLLYNTRYENQ